MLYENKIFLYCHNFVVLNTSTVEEIVYNDIRWTSINYHIYLILCITKQFFIVF